MKNTLTKEYRDSFCKSGFVKLDNFFEDAQMASLRREVDQIHLLNGIIAVREKDQPELLCRVEDFLDKLPELKSLVFENVIPVVSELMGEDAVVFKEKLNFKWPGGGAFRPHQDFPAYRFFPPDYHITAMISVDSSNEENGCLQFCGVYREILAGFRGIDPSRLAQGREQLPQNQQGDIREEIQSKLQWLKVPTQPRDLVLFDSYVPHYSEPNSSPNQSRQAIFITCNAKSFGEFRTDYYRLKRKDPGNPMFHVGTPTRMD